MLTAASPNRRDALKVRHRAAILDAARELVAERGGPGFTVDELAERADVARRTVFNHFPSVDDILITLCVDSLDVVIEEFMATVAAIPVGDGSRESMFNELSESLRASDVPVAIARISLILGEPGADPSREQILTDQAFARAADRLLREVERRHPDADSFDVELLVGSLMNGLIVSARHWTQSCGVRLDSEGRTEWRRLLDRLIESMRSGYMLSS